MKRFTTTIGIVFLMLFAAKANYLLLPMDNLQKNHLNAYGIAFQENIELEQTFSKKCNAADLAARIYIVEVTAENGAFIQQMIVKGDESL